MPWRPEAHRRRHPGGRNRRGAQLRASGAAAAVASLRLHARIAAAWSTNASTHHCPAGGGERPSFSSKNRSRDVLADQRPLSSSTLSLSERVEDDRIDAIGDAATISRRLVETRALATAFDRRVRRSPDAGGRAQPEALVVVQVVERVAEALADALNSAAIALPTGPVAVP